MTKKEAMKLIASHYERIKKIVLMSENKYFPNNKGCYHEDITQDLLQLNNHLYEEAQEMDLTPLTLPTFFDNIVKTYAGANG